MDKPKNDDYRRGYVAGYIDGLHDAAAGKTIQTHNIDVEKLPLKAMDISARGQNCLAMAGCMYISDVVKLSRERIIAMRNMGPVTASEIAHWLTQHNICFTSWNEFL